MTNTKSLSRLLLGPIRPALGKLLIGTTILAGSAALIESGPARADWGISPVGQSFCNFFPGLALPALNPCAKDTANPNAGYFSSPVVIDKILTPLFYDAPCGANETCIDELSFYLSGGSLPFHVDLDFNPDIGSPGSFVYKLDIVAGSPYVFDEAGLSGLATTASPNLTKIIGTGWNGQEITNELLTLDSNGVFVAEQIPGHLKTIFVQDKWAPVGGSVDAIQNVYSQVPGPLPLLGAGAAFGFSRRLRRRIKQRHCLG